MNCAPRLGTSHKTILSKNILGTTGERQQGTQQRNESEKLYLVFIELLLEKGVGRFALTFDKVALAGNVTWIDSIVIDLCGRIRSGSESTELTLLYSWRHSTAARAVLQLSRKRVDFRHALYVRTRRKMIINQRHADVRTLCGVGSLCASDLQDQATRIAPAK